MDTVATALSTLAHWMASAEEKGETGLRYETLSY